MADEDDTTVPLSENESNQTHRISELELRLRALEKAFEKRGYNTQPLWEILQERLEKAEKQLSAVDRKAIKTIKPATRKCIFCHNGVYIEALDSRKLSGNQLVGELIAWGLNYKLDKPSKDWIILSCNYCGNLQVFNLTTVQNTKAWK